MQPLRTCAGYHVVDVVGAHSLSCPRLACSVCQGITWSLPLPHPTKCSACSQGVRRMQVVSRGPAEAFARGQLAYAVTTWLLLCLWRCAYLPHNTDSSSNEADQKEVQGEPQQKRTNGKQPAQSLVSWYARQFGADAGALAATAIFAWQACQKMLLQEATKCGLCSLAPQLFRLPLRARCAHLLCCQLAGVVHHCTLLHNASPRGSPYI